MKSVILNLAPTGMVATKKDSPFVPVSRAEIVDDVSRCVSAGVSMVHVHARCADGAPSSDARDYAEIFSDIRNRFPSVVLVATTSGRAEGAFEKRSAVLDLPDDLRPDMASLTLSSLNFMQQASINSPDMVRRLAEKMQEKGIRPELEVFDLGMLNYAHYLIDKGSLTPPYYFNFLLGNIASAQVSLLHLGALISGLPPDSLFSVAGLGRFQTRALMMGLPFADGVRVGLEDNLWMDDARSTAATNLALVQRAVRLAGELEREPMCALELRQRLKLSARK